MGISIFVPKIRSYSMGDSDKNEKTRESTEKDQKGWSFMEIIYFAFHACKIYFLWSILHYVASQYYVRYCAPSTIYGFLMSPFLVTMPHCQAMRYMIYHGGLTIESMWLIFGTWISAKLIKKH